MRPSRIASAAGWITRRTRHDRLLPGAPRSGHGSVVFGVAVVALITRFHPHYGSTTHGTFSTTGLVVVAIVLVISFGVRWFMRNRRGLSGHAGADGGPGAADRVVVVVEDADEIGSGQDDPQLEGELGGVGAVWQLIPASRSAGFRDEQVAPLLLDAGYLVVDTARLGADLGGGSDEEAPAGEDPPLDIGQVALAQGEQALASRAGGAEGRADNLGPRVR